VRPHTLEAQRRLYLLARALVARHYSHPLTLELLARTLASSPRQLQRVYARFGGSGFRTDLAERRMAAAAELLVSQPSIPVAEVARLVGYSQAPHFARAFRRRYGTTPSSFRAAGTRGRPGAPRGRA
jgi:AraC-like DNA-binding protein